MESQEAGLPPQPSATLMQFPPGVYFWKLETSPSASQDQVLLRKVVAVLSWVQLATSSIILICQILKYVTWGYVYFLPLTISFGILGGVTGGVSLYSSCKATRCSIISSLMLCMISLVLSLIIIFHSYAEWIGIVIYERDSQVSFKIVPQMLQLFCAVCLTVSEFLTLSVCSRVICCPGTRFPNSTAIYVPHQQQGQPETENVSAPENSMEDVNLHKEVQNQRTSLPCIPE